MGVGNAGIRRYKTGAALAIKFRFSARGKKMERSWFRSFDQPEESAGVCTHPDDLRVRPGAKTLVMKRRDEACTHDTNTKLPGDEKAEERWAVRARGQNSSVLLTNAMRRLSGDQEGTLIVP
jgi:hypothetical protein